MAEPTPLSLSQFFSELTGRHVNFALAVNPPASKAKLLYGAYTVQPEGRPLLLKIAAKTLGLLGGSLLGMPEDTSIERAQETPLNDPLRDAMHEVLNIASTAIMDNNRVVFQSMARDLTSLPSKVGQLERNYTRRNAYKVTVDGAHTEVLTILQ